MSEEVIIVDPTVGHIETGLPKFSKLTELEVEIIQQAFPGLEITDSDELPPVRMFRTGGPDWMKCLVVEKFEAPQGVTKIEYPDVARVEVAQFDELIVDGLAVSAVFQTEEPALYFLPKK